MMAQFPFPHTLTMTYRLRDVKAAARGHSRQQ
jgi:hypothetical protein